MICKFHPLPLEGYECTISTNNTKFGVSIRKLLLLFLRVLTYTLRPVYELVLTQGCSMENNKIRTLLSPSSTSDKFQTAKQLGLVVRAKCQRKPNRKTKAAGNWSKIHAECQQGSWQKLENYVQLQQITARAHSQEKWQRLEQQSCWAPK